MLEAGSKAMWRALTLISFGEKSVQAGLSDMWTELRHIIAPAESVPSIITPCEYI